MKRLIALAAAGFLASTALSVAQDNSDNGPGASEHAPGQMKSEGESARDLAPGQMKSEGESARDYAPGQQVDEDTTGSIGDDQFDHLLSIIGSGDFNIGDVSADADVRIVSLSDLSEEELQELQQAISENQDSIDSLRQELASLDLPELEESEIDAAVAADLNAEGELVVYVR